MRKSKLFPLLSGLVLTMTVGCGDDGSDDANSNDTDTTAEDASSETTETDDTTESDETNQSDTDTTVATSDDSDSDSDDSTESETPNDGGATDGGEATDGGGGDDADGGASDDDGGTTDSDDGGGITLGDGGSDAGVDAEVDAAPLPEGACAQSPANPDNGTYADCDGTLTGGTCQLTCTENNFIGGIATCTDGVWAEAACIELGSLTAEIGDAADGTDLPGAIVYIEGFYDPASDDCEANVYCDVTGSNGIVEFEGFPSGEQKVVIVADGYDEIALPVNIGPGDDRSIHLDALPTGFLAGNIVVLLGWETAADLDLVLAVPGEVADSDAGADAGASPVSCVFRADSRRGSLAAAPFARLEKDSKPPATPRGPETLRIAPNGDNSGPYYDGSYSLVVMSASPGISLSEAQPSVRVITANNIGGANVELFALPEDAVEDATEWHVLDLNALGATAVGTTESNIEDASQTNLPCVEEAFTIVD